MSDNNLNLRVQIDAYVKGTLSEQEISDLWVEFAKKPELLEELEIEVGVRELITKNINKSTEQKGANITKLPGWTWSAAAAAVIIIMGLVQLFNIPAQTSLDEMVVQTIPSDQLETADGIRAKDMSIFAADSLLNLGFSAYISGNKPQALRLFNEVIVEYDFEPYGSKAYLNSGIIFYNDGNYDDAISAFNNALDRVENSRMIEEKAWWFLGNALVNTDQPEEARIAVANAYSLEGVYRNPAFLLLQKLNYDLGYLDAEEVNE